MSDGALHAFFCLLHMPAGSWYTKEGWWQNSVNCSGTLISDFNDRDVSGL